MLDKNLKGTHHKLLYYRYRPTGEEEAKIRIVGESEQTYLQKEIEKIYIPEEEIRRFSLDKHGQPIPYIDGHVTIINNYIFDYWGHFLGAEGVALYGHLKRYCYGDKDYCFPNLKLIEQKMNKSRNTVKKYLGILEKYGFALVFNVLNADKKNMEESPLYKVRKKVPFLPKELYEELPSELKLDHDRYMQQIIENFDQILDLDTSIDYTEIYEEVIEKGSVVRKVKTPLELDKELQIKKKILEKEITELDRDIWRKLQESVAKKISKPSYDTWFKLTFCIKRDQTYTIYSPNRFVSDWLEDKYRDLIQTTLALYDSNFSKISYEYLNYERN